MSIKIGTASWTDTTLIKCGRFYPAGCSTPQDRLRFYASRFPLVEVDSSYYGIPSAPTAALWATRTPPDFTFDIKAFRLFTGHQTEPKCLPKDLQAELPKTDAKYLYYLDVPAAVVDELWRRFFEVIEPLHEAGKLGAVLFQFAPWITSGPRERAHLEHCADRMHRYPTAFEFRNSSWLDEAHWEETLAFERARRLVHVVMDAPSGVRTRANTIWEATSPDLAIVRLHGRNAKTWAGSASAAERFNYDYSETELTELAAPIRALAHGVAQVHVIFNNCYEDLAQRNAVALSRMLNG